jgi:two-component system sensor kinase FixL
MSSLSPALADLWDTVANASPQVQKRIRWTAWILTGLIGITSKLVTASLALSLLYVIPIVLSALSVSRWPVLLMACTCTFLREAFLPVAWDPDGPPRFIIVALAFIALGLFVNQLYLSQATSRQAASELDALLNATPAGLVILEKNRIVNANRATHELLRVGHGSLIGREITGYLPGLAKASIISKHHQMRTVMEDRGYRSDGEALLAYMWFCSFESMTGPKMAAFILDGSEELREREGTQLQALMLTSRVLIRSVFHEIQNLSQAGLAAYTGIARSVTERDDDVVAIGSVLRRLGDIASEGLGNSQSDTAVESRSNVEDVLTDLRIILEPSFNEIDARVRWEVERNLPNVRGDSRSLLHVFMNLAQNSLHAIQQSEKKELGVKAYPEGQSVIVRFEDTGSGVAEPDRLFKPFQTRRAGHGLGLYVSSATVKAFGGDISYEPAPTGAVFVVRLAAAS